MAFQVFDQIGQELFTSRKLIKFKIHSLIHHQEKHHGIGRLVLVEVYIVEVCYIYLAGVIAAEWGLCSTLLITWS